LLQPGRDVLHVFDGVALLADVLARHAQPRSEQALKEAYAHGWTVLEHSWRKEHRSASVEQWLREMLAFLEADLPEDVLAGGEPVEVAGQVMGTVIATGVPPELAPRERNYLERTNRALAYSALGAAVVALILGYLGRLGPFNWNIPLVANTVLRNFGFTLFLASVGMSSGAPFVESIGGPGISLFVAGACVVLTSVLMVLLIGYFILRNSYGTTTGINGYQFESFEDVAATVGDAFVFDFLN